MRKMKSYKVVSILLCVFMFVQALPMDVFASAQMTGMTQESVSESDVQTSVSDPQIAPSEITNDPMGLDQDSGDKLSMFAELKELQEAPGMLPNVGNTFNGIIVMNNISYSFVKLVFSKLYGSDISNSNIVDQLVNYEFTSIDVKNLMQQAKMGDVIQAHGDMYENCNMIFIKATDQSVLVYDCMNDLDGKNDVKERYISYDTLVNYFSYPNMMDDMNYIRILRANNYLSLYEEVDSQFVDDTLNFDIDEGLLIEYKGNQPVVVIPETVQYIDQQAFSSNQTMKALVIPSSVTFVDNNAFEYCPQLSGVYFPNSVIKLGENMFKESRQVSYIHLSNKITAIPKLAFADLENLKFINIPKKVTKIETLAFAGCSSLKEVVLPPNLKSLGDGAFFQCTGIESVNIPRIYTEYAPSDYMGMGPFQNCANLKKVSFEKNITNIPAYLFKNCEGLLELTLPSTIKYIGESAFEGAVNLKKISLPETLDEIGMRAFQDCISLEKIEIPNSVTSIQIEAFKGCSKLKSLYLSDSLEGISESTFEACTSLEEIVFPNKLEEIDVKAFAKCDSLTTLDLPTTITSIGNYAFHNCNALVTVNIPNSVINLGNEAFAECDSLTNVNLGTGIKSLSTGTFAFCNSLRHIVLPYRLESIGSRAFGSNFNLQTVSIPKSTTSIEDDAFEGCTSLSIEGYIGSYAIGFAHDNGIIYQTIEDQVDYVVEAEKVSLNKRSANLYVNESLPLQLDLAPTNCTQDVVWSSLDDTIASVDNYGVITGVAEGKTVILVTVGNKQARMEVTVVGLIDDIQLIQDDIELYVGEKSIIEYAIIPETSHDNLFFTSMDESIASVDEKGVVTAKGVGTVNVKLQSQDAKNASVICTINVVGMEYHVNTKEEFQSSHPYASDTNESYVYTQKGSKEVSITFSKETFVEDGVDYIYILDKNNKQVGKYTGSQLSKKTIKVKGDTVKVRLVVQGNGNSWGFSVVGANKPFPVLPTSINLNYTNLIMKTNTQTILNATVLPSNSVDKSVRYESSDASVVSVEDGVLTAQQEGVAAIWVFGYRDMNYAICTVRVVKEVDGMWVEEIPSQTYTGKAIKPEIKVYDGQTLLTLGKDYKLQYFNNVNVGNIHSVKPPTILVKGIGNYSKSVKSYFEIQPVRINSIDVKTQINDVKYTGKVNQSKPEVMFIDKKLVLNKDYTLEYIDLYDTNCIGQKDETTKIQVVIKGKGNYSGSRTIAYNIIAKDVRNASVSKIVDLVYTGSAITPDPVIQYQNGKVLEPLTKYNPITKQGDYTITYLQNTQVGTAKMMIKGKNEYGGSKTITFKIKAKPMSHLDVTTTVSANQTYSPDGLYGFPEIYDKGVLLTNGVDYTFSYKNTDITKISSTHKPTVVIKGKGNYTGERKLEFSLWAKPISDSSITIEVRDALYSTTKAAEGSVIIKDNGKLLKLNKDYKLMYGDNGNIGPAKVAIIGCGNYGLAVEREFQVSEPIQMSDPKIDVVGITDKTYFAKSEIPDFDVTYMGATLTKNVDYKVSYRNTVKASDASSAKPPTIKITGMGIYQGTITKTYTIKPFEMSEFAFLPFGAMSFYMSDVRYVAGQPAKPRPTVKFGTTVLKENVDYTISYKDNTQIREADAPNPPTITIIGIGNFGGSYSQPYRIYEKSIEKLSFSKIGAQLYTGLAIKPYTNIIDKTSNKTLVEGIDYTVTYDNNENVGYGEAIITGIGTYGGTKKIRFLILPKIFKWFLG